MVCITWPSLFVMSTRQTREVVSACSRSQARMQTVADLLLLTSDSRPVTTDTLAVFGESYAKCRETIITRTKGLLVLTSQIKDLLYNVTTRWNDVCACLQDICELVVGLTECCAHAAYLMGINKPNCVPAVPGVVEPYRVCKANMEIDLSCSQLKKCSVEDLTPNVLVHVCSTINRSLTVMSECFRYASEKTYEVTNQDQFKLCIKTFTSSASCLISSIRTFKSQPCGIHHRRCICFADSLLAATNAATNFATEETFTGRTARLTQEAKEAQKEVLGSCLGIVSACVQLSKAVQELAYNNTSESPRQRLPMCNETISRSSSQLAQALLKHHVAEHAPGHNR